VVDYSLLSSVAEVFSYDFDYIRERVDRNQWLLYLSLLMNFVVVAYLCVEHTFYGRRA
jgi:hypothetical protein